MPMDNREIPFVVITYHDAFLWSIRHKKDDYIKGVSIIQLSEKDVNRLGISSGNTISLSNKSGKIEAKVEIDKSCPDGFGFMPKSPVINQLVSYEEELPNFKWIGTTAVVYSHLDKSD